LRVLTDPPLRACRQGLSFRKMAMIDQPLVVLTSRPKPGVDTTRALRRLLRYALRSCCLHCIAVHEDPPVLEDGPQGRVADDEIGAHTPPNGGNA
jgi:hypothetical protein